MNGKCSMVDSKCRTVEFVTIPFTTRRGQFGRDHAEHRLWVTQRESFQVIAYYSCVIGAPDSFQAFQPPASE